MTLPGYDVWLDRGSGSSSYDKAVVLRDPCSECGTTDGLLHVDDFGTQTLFCGNPDCDTEIQAFYDESEV